jgi:hypothetical protein
VQRDLTAALNAAPEVAELVERRLFWKRRPQGSPLPAVVMHRVHGQPQYTLEGRSGLTPYIVQFDCRAKTYSEALALSEAVITALGRLTRSPFHGAFLRDLRDDTDTDDGPQASPVADDFLVSLDAQVWHFKA